MTVLDCDRCGALRCRCLAHTRSALLLHLAFLPTRSTSIIHRRCLSEVNRSSFRRRAGPRGLGLSVNPGSDSAFASVLMPQPVDRNDFPRTWRSLPRATKSLRLTVLRWRCGRRRCSGPVRCLLVHRQGRDGRDLV